MNKIHVIGHLPPPVTGENLCRRHLEVTLQELDHRVASHSRSDLRNFILFRSRIWLVSGGKPLGHVRDLMWLIWWRLLGCHVSIYIHNISWRYFKKHARFWRLLGSRHFRYIVLTEEIANTLNSAGLPASRLNNTLTDGDEPVALASRIPVKRLLWMSAVTAEKGFIVAYDTFLTLRAKDPAWHLDVYGAGLLAGNTDRFTYANFHGFTHGTKKQAALDAGGIFILPSHYINETQPLSIIEALANGIPFVASTIGGIKAMQGSGSSSLAGVCLEASSPVSDWVEAVEAVYDNYEAFSRAAITTYKTDFSRAAYRAGVSRLIDKSLN